MPHILNKTSHMYKVCNEIESEAAEIFALLNNEADDNHLRYVA